MSLPIPGDPPIKGPGLRLDVDVRRLWECPACGRQLKLHGWVVTRRCTCDKSGSWMRLVEPPRVYLKWEGMEAALTELQKISEDSRRDEEVVDDEVSAMSEEMVGGDETAVVVEATVEAIPAVVEEPATNTADTRPGERSPEPPEATVPSTDTEVVETTITDKPSIPSVDDASKPSSDTPAGDAESKPRRSKRNRSRRRREGKGGNPQAGESSPPKAAENAPEKSGDGSPKTNPPPQAPEV